MSSPTPLRYRLMFYGGENHSHQILVTAVDAYSNNPVETGSFKWLRRNPDKTFSPIKGAETRCYAPTADDLYTILRVEYTSPDGKVVLADVPPPFFKMNPEVEKNVAKYVEMGRSTGISFNVLNPGNASKTGAWTIVAYANQIQLRYENSIFGSYDQTTAIVLSPSDPTVFRVADNYLQTTDIKMRDEIVLTLRALIGVL